MKERLLVKLAEFSNEGIVMYHLSGTDYEELKESLLFDGDIIDENRKDDWYVGTVFGVELYYHKK